MGVTAERLPRSLVALEIEVDDERLEAQMDKAVRRLSQRVRIPGFRPGKAPRMVVERTLGRPALLQEALEELLPDVYNEAIEAEDIQAIGQPEFDLKSTEPLVVSATVPVRPTIDLRDYRSLRAPRPEVEAPDGRVEEALTSLLRRYATLEPVDRAVQWDDVVRMDVTVSVEGQEEPPHEEEGAEFAVTEGNVVSLPGFLEHLIGLERGGPHQIEFALPESVYFCYYAGSERFTRIVEYKKFTRHKAPTTLITMEIPTNTSKYYPMPFESEKAKAKQYFDLMPDGVFSIGRAGSYLYNVDIDDTIDHAMTVAAELKG